MDTSLGTVKKKCTDAIANVKIAERPTMTAEGKMLALAAAMDDLREAAKGIQGSAEFINRTNGEPIPSRIYGREQKEDSDG
jgi:hypothetical protein